MSNPLWELLTDNSYPPRSAAYKEEVVRLVAEYYNQEQNADTTSFLVRIADILHHLRNNDPDKHWMAHWKSLPWYKRLYISKKAPEWYRDDFIKIQKDKAREDYDKALAKMKGL